MLVKLVYKLWMLVSCNVLFHSYLVRWSVSSRNYGEVSTTLNGWTGIARGSLTNGAYYCWKENHLTDEVDPVHSTTE